MQLPVEGRTGEVRILGEPIYYQIAGAGQPLVLIHAGVADSRMWDEQFAFFSPHFQVLRYDLRGAGRSGVSRRFSHHDDLAALLDHLGIPAAVLLGISFGARVALDFCLAYPQRVKGLVLVSPSIGGHRPSQELQQFEAQEEELLQHGDLDGAADLNVRMWVDGPHREPVQVRPEIRRLVHVMQRQAFTIPWPGDVEYLELQPPALERLHEIRVPALIAAGGLDVQDFLDQARLLADSIPAAQMMVFPDAAHMLTLERPGEFNDAVLRYLQSVLTG